ncbi:aminoglycoside phosphotransferase family protein [Pseudomonas koreensis]|uniref:aminoglycoside phosphotransferase family protein n=1 Tax=Pseudomonas koreensis TaxID=198620 RepID=UPI003F8672F9
MCGRKKRITWTAVAGKNNWVDWNSFSPKVPRPACVRVIDTATFGPWLQRWALVSDGEAVITLGSRLLPVRFGDAPAMLKIELDADEQYGNRLMTWWDGDGATQVLAHHEDGLHAGCLSGVRVFGRRFIANVLHALVAFSTIADWIHRVIYTHQLRHRECFRITDDRP